ncbi:MAG: hypothetical protein ACUVXJ_04330 [Phycisphaerae bacterium]
MNWLERFWTGCGHCKGGQGCPLVEANNPGGSGGTGGMALRAAVVFLLPLTSAIVCSCLAWRMWASDAAGSIAGWQIGGMAVGIAVGIALAKVLIRIMRQR